MINLASTFPIAQAAAPAGAQQPGLLSSMIPFILIIGIFYFLMIRPQQRKEKELRKQIEELKAGARILFCGGMIGKIVETKPSTFMVEIADGTVVEIARGAVARVLKDNASLEEPEKK